MIEHHAQIDNAPGDLFSQIAETARRNGYAADTTEGRLRVKAPLGIVELTTSGQRTRIRFSTETAPKMQLFKELYAERFETFGVPAGQIQWEHVSAQRPLNQHLALVTSSMRLSPGFQRVRLAGDFSAFAQPGAGLHFRFLLHPEGADWPRLDDRGLIDWPGGIASWHRPVFTIRAISDDADWIDVDIALHDGGRTSAWATAAKAGDPIAIQGPSGSSLVEASWLGLVGDETALPVLARLIEAAPFWSQGVAVFMLRDPRDAQDIANDTQIEIRVVDISADPTSYLSDIAPPSPDAHLFFAGEKAQATRMRTAFKAQGLQGKCASYWTA